MYASYFSEQLRELKQEYREHIYNSDFTDITVQEEQTVMKLTLGWATLISTMD